MASKSSPTKDHITRVLSGRSLDDLEDQLKPNKNELPQRLAVSAKTSEAMLDKRWERIGLPEAREELNQSESAEVYANNIENLIGTVKVPVGVAGPLRVNGLFAKGDFWVPLATTEAALVASYARGCTLLTAAGGCTCLVLNEAVNRSPAFSFSSVSKCGLFVAWAVEKIDDFKEIVKSTTAHGQLVDVSTTIEGNHVYLNFEFTTGDASGQNMVTIATQAVCEFILEQTPVKPDYHYVEGNLSGDKKASVQSFTTVRGKKVCAEVRLTEALISKHLHTTPKALVDYWQMSAIGGVLSGTVGVQGHFANGLAALYLACGQDVACVAESAVGVTRFDLTDDGGLYAAVTLPNIMVGTVGGRHGIALAEGVPGHSRASRSRE